MNITFLVSINKTDDIDFDKVRANSLSKLNLVTTEEAYRLCDDRKKEYFDDIIFVEEVDSGDGYFKKLDEGQVKEKVGRYLSDFDYERVSFFTFWEFDVETTLDLIEQYSPHGKGSFTSDYFRDKLLMKSVVEENGLRVPKNEVLDKDRLEEGLSYYEDLTCRISDVLIFKPIDASGSVGVLKVSNFDDYLLAVSHIVGSKYSYEVEEYIDGDLFHCDFVVSGKRVLYRSCGEYFSPLLECERGSLLGSVLLPTKFGRGKLVLDFAEKCLMCFGLVDAAVHMEVFVCRKTSEPIFLELACRPPGMPGMSRMIDMSIFTLTALVMTGSKHVHVQYLPDELYTCWGHIPSKKGGRVVELPKSESGVHMDWRCKEGDIVNRETSYFNPLACFYMKSYSLTDIHNKVKTISCPNYVRIR